MAYNVTKRMQPLLPEQSSAVTPAPTAAKPPTMDMNAGQKGWGTSALTPKESYCAGADFRGGAGRREADTEHFRSFLSLIFALFVAKTHSESA
mgnify:CR=1 FL=1